MTKHYATPRRGIVAVRAHADGDVKALFEDLNKDWSAFKASMEDKDKEVAKRFDDVVTTEKLSRIEASIGETNAKYEAEIDKLNAKLAAVSVNPTDDGLSDAEREYKATFENWFRTGDGESQVKAALRSGEIRAAGEYATGDDERGGYTAPIEWDRSITDKRVEISPMRRFASVQTVTGQGFKRLYNLHGTASAWVGETANRPQTAGSVLAEYAFSFGEIYAMPAATQRILEDSEISIEQWLAGEVNTEFARQEGIAFVNGDGTNKPKGILRYDATAEGLLDPSLRHPLGPIAEVATGSAAALSADGLIDLVYDLPEDRSQGAALFANRKTQAIIRKMKDGDDNNYLWQPPFQAGQPAQVLGQPIHELAGLPDVAAGTIPVLFGNMAETYRIFDRVGMSVLRDPYTNKPYVLFYTRKRVGGGLWNPEWMRYHRVGVATPAT